MPFDPNQVKHRREALTLTQEEAAARAGWKGASGRIRWTEIEIGKYADPRISKLERVAAALGCLVDDLLIKTSGARRSPDRKAAPARRART